jgi:iron complex outermembrane receptor protein
MKLAPSGAEEPALRGDNEPMRIDMPIADSTAPTHDGACLGRAFASTLAALLLAAAVPARAAAGDLTALSLEQLLGVTIVGASKYEQKQRDVAAAVSVITRQEIQAFGWRTLAEALASLPGVHTTGDRQYSYLGMRGFGLPGDFNTRTLVTIDGNRVNDPTFDTGPPGRDFPLDMDLVERIEFIPGPGGAVYGQNAMLGVVNVITRNGASLGGFEVTASTKSPQAEREGRLSFGRRFAGGVDLLLSVSGLRARGQDLFFDYGASGQSGVARGLDGERGQQLLLRVAAGNWSFEHVHGQHRKDDPTGALLSDPLVPGSYQGDGQDLTQLQYQGSNASDTLRLSARLFLGRERYRSRLSYGGSALSFPADSRWRGTELRLLSTAWAGHKLMLGLELQDNTRQDQAVIDLANPANNLLIAVRGHRIGAYGQDEWQIADTLAATLGLRLDRSDISSAKASPRAALIWRAATDTTLKALAGRAHRAPNAYERDYGDGVSQVANPALRGESIDTVELVADHRVGSNLSLRASLYQWTMRDLVTLGSDPVSGLSQYQAGDTVKAHGVELSADKTWGRGTRLRVSLSLQDVGYANGGRLPNSPRLLAKLNLSAPLPLAGLRLGYQFGYDGRRPSLDGSSLGGYALSGLHVSSNALAPGLELSVGIDNLFGKRYAQPAADTNWQNALEQDGRSLRLRLGCRF